jgi:Recombination endonuclease VII
MHRLSGVKPDLATGNCLECGPVDLYWRPSTGRWVCRVGKRLQKGDTKTPRISDDPSRIAGLAAQGNQCLICYRGLTSSSAKWDHDHATGGFRGYLCHNCNTALGLFGDDPALLQRATAYVKTLRPFST